MPITIDYGNTNIISVPQSFLTHISGTLYELDTDVFRLALKDIEDSAAGIPFPSTHIHNTQVTVAGTTYARTIEIISPYSVQFTPDAQYSVKLVGSNNNIFDVESGILVQNQVQIIPTNSAGLIVTTIGSGLSAAEQAKLDEIWKIHGLDENTPMVVSPTERTAGPAIEQTFTEDDPVPGSIKTTRNP